ncbi:MAG: hypothetical protein HRU00_17215 [Myxococcales bacterium]|nr:hypothetical protein [Myxococcales bacterium]
MICIYVLQTLPPGAEEHLLRKLAELLAFDGHAYIAVRANMVDSGPLGEVTESGTFKAALEGTAHADLDKQIQSVCESVAQGSEG